MSKEIELKPDSKGKLDINDLVFKQTVETLPFINLKDGEIFIGYLRDKTTIGEGENQMDVLIGEDYESGQMYYIAGSYSIIKAYENYSDRVLQIEFEGKEEFNNKPFNKFKICVADQ